MRPLLVTSAPIIDLDARAILGGRFRLLEIPADRRDALEGAVANADAILAYPPMPIDKALIARAPQLKLIASAASGVDHIDVDAASATDVIVTNVADVGTRSITAHVSNTRIKRKNDVKGKRV